MIRIYHNPHCSKSRAALELLQQHGQPFEVVHYLDTPPDAAQLKTWLRLLGISARALLRHNEDEYQRLQLDDSSLDENALIAAMATHPRLIERPIVEADGKAVIARPPEKLFDIVRP